MTFFRICDYEGQRIDLLEMFLLSMKGTDQKYKVLNHFEISSRAYIKEYILDLSFVKEGDKNSHKVPPLILRNLKSKKVRHVREIDDMLKNSRFSTDQLEVLSRSVAAHCQLMNHKQACEILMKWANKQGKYRFVFTFCIHKDCNIYSNISLPSR